MTTRAQGGDDKKPDDFMDIARRVGDETISSLRNEQRGGKTEETGASSDSNPAEQDRGEFRSIFHDDDNLQDEQAEFDANNPPENLNTAINNLLAKLGQKKNGDTKETSQEA
jgi:hypothetical protein